MTQKDAEKILDRIQAAKNAVPARLRGVPVNVIPEPGNSFRILLSMVNKNAMDAARRLNDIGADIKPWPPEGHCEAVCTWDTTLHYLTMTEDLVFRRTA